MSLDKAIESGKEHRKQYRGSKRFDKSCRNHGNHGHGPGHECNWCKGNRLHANKVRSLKTLFDLKDYDKGTND